MSKCFGEILHKYKFLHYKLEMLLFTVTYEVSTISKNGIQCFIHRVAIVFLKIISFKTLEVLKLEN